VDAACSNLEPKAVRKRAVGGVVALVAGLAVGYWLIAAGYARPWRLATFPVFLFAGIGLFQARHRV
jgi:hypothetical protein